MNQHFKAGQKEELERKWSQQNAFAKTTLKTNQSCLSVSQKALWGQDKSTLHCLPCLQSLRPH